MIRDELVRCELYRYGDVFYSLLDVHHLLLDGYSVYLLSEDMKKVFSGKRLSREKRSYFDELEAIYELSKSESYRFHREYYNELLRGSKSLLYPISESPDSDLPLYGDCVLDVGLPDFIEKSRNASVTPFHMILAAFTKALETATGETAFSIVAFYSGRDDRTAYFLKSI